MLKSIDEFMTDSAWNAYERVAQGGQFSFAKPLPGWQLEPVQSDGTIGNYRTTERHAMCKRNRSPWHPRPALEHCRNCDCGHKISRDVLLLLYYARYRQAQHGINLSDSDTVSLALTRVHGYGTAEHCRSKTSPKGTIRTSNVRLVEVFLPTEHDGNTVPSGLADKIQDRYKVNVQHIDGGLFDQHRQPLPGDSMTAWRFDGLNDQLALGSAGGIEGSQTLDLLQAITGAHRAQSKCVINPDHKHPIKGCYCGIHAVRDQAVFEDLNESFVGHVLNNHHDRIAVSQIRLHGPLFDHDINDPAGTVVGSAAEYQRIYIPRRHLDQLHDVPRDAKIYPLESLSAQWHTNLETIQKETV